MRRSLTSIETWQQLRVIARAGNEPTTGKAIRLWNSRKTKDGTFLDKLVATGLLELVELAPVEKPKYKGSTVKPRQFRSTYRLTPLGLTAADFGEYESPEPKRTAKTGKAR